MTPKPFAGFISSFGFFVSLMAAGSVFSIFSANAATLFHSNDILGDLEPCGCRTNPLGGMARKYNLLKKVEDPSILQLDAGDLLFSSETIPSLLQDQAKVQAGYMLKSFDLVHHSAVTPGEKDYALGFKVFEKLRKNSKTKFLAANLKKKNGSKYLDSHFVFKMTDGDKPLKVGVFGLVGTALTWPKELKATPALAAAKAEVAALKKDHSDLIIALTHQGVEEDRVLAKKVPGIDLIIGGHTQSFLQEPLVIENASGKTVIVQSSFRNQYIGQLQLKKPFSMDGYKLIAVDAAYDSPADSQSAMDDLVKEFKTAVANLNSQMDAKMAAQTSSSVRSDPDAVKYQTFPRCAECHYKQFDFWRKTAHARALEPLIEKKQYLNKECLTCHTVGLGDPKGFNNVNVLAEFIQLKKASDASISKPDGVSSSSVTKDPEPEPLPIDDLRQFLKEMNERKSMKDLVKLSQSGSESKPMHEALHSLVRAWTPVQCENCHSPGENHPLSEGYSKAVPRDTCLKCHTPERAPEWFDAQGKPNWEVIDGKRKLVTCPAGESSVEE